MYKILLTLTCNVCFLLCSCGTSVFGNGNTAEEIRTNEEMKKELPVFEKIIETNKRSNMLDQLIEGDIMQDVFRNAHGNKWPKSRDGLVRVPYKVSKEYSSRNRSEINRAISFFEEHTCIRFVPRKSQKKYLSIENDKGCRSFVGRTSSNKQKLTLEIPGCISTGVIIHELMHAIGFAHEHSRSDRDQYIEVITENVEPKRKTFFARISDTKNLVVYDYTSVMHYSRNSFPKHRYLPTIKVRSKINPEPDIGFRDKLSAYDIEEIKYHYECSGKTYDRCGKDFRNKNKGIIKSPRYPNLYPSEAHCTWTITVSKKSLIKLTFSTIQLEDSNHCQLDSIIVHDGKNANAKVLIKLCGKQSYLSFTSTGNELFIIFTSDSSYRFKGFSASFRKVSKRIKPRITPIKTNYIEEFRCNFGKHMCGMMHGESASHQFRYQSGKTPTPNTGPSSGKYIYMESSNIPYGSNGIIMTPWLRGIEFCVQFSYHMYGSTMGGLRLYALENIAFLTLNGLNGRIKTALWENFGDQDDRWRTAKVSYRSRRILFITFTKDIQFYWEGYIAGSSSDIALDNIAITAGKCS